MENSYNELLLGANRPRTLVM